MNSQYNQRYYFSHYPTFILHLSEVFHTCNFFIWIFYLPFLLFKVSMFSQIIIHVCKKPCSCFPLKCCQFGYERSWLSDLIFLNICSLGFCIGLCHLACHKVIFLSFWGLLNAGWHQLCSNVKPILWVISQCIIIKSNTLCVTYYLEQTKLGKLFPSVLYLETKSCNTRTCVHSHLLTDLHVAKIWQRIFLQLYTDVLQPIFF